MNESQIFAAALKLATHAERAAYLDGACAGDPKLRAGVEALLQVQAQDPAFLDQPAAPIGGTVDQVLGTETDSNEDPLDQPGAVLAGRYKLVEMIGEGGMGTVWMAQQTEPVKRIVAVKLIKAGMDSKQVLARFEAERQALALMDHPNIAKVLDAGATDCSPLAPREGSRPLAEREGYIGRPFFVMELVKGVPITKYCDEHRLTPRQRLELFLPVCHAIQHAHQKGIIHRDIKPSNVLVAPYDGKPVPKVIDFGVAKAAGQQLTDRTLLTGFGAIVGTLEYMSPEQAELNNRDIDTRSDIYALGVLLYELLTGSTPLDRQRLKQAAFTEMLRIIREEEPAKPSTRLSDSKDSLPSISAQRHMEPAKLTRLVRGELDWIVMKALDKDRNRRYETANGFAMDVQRYLADEPVQACPPSAGYRLRKFVRRNKAALLTAGVVAAVLVLGTVVSTWQAIRATRAEWLAQERLDAETTARAEAERERKAAQAAQAEEAKQRALAQKNAEEADGQRRRAEANFLLARKAVDDMYTDVAERWLNEQPELEPLQRDFLAKALKYYQGFAQVKEGEAAVRLEAAQASRRVGAMKAMLEQYSEPTVQAYRQASDILETLVQEFPREPKYREPLAEVYLGLAIQLLLGRKTHEAEKVARRGVSLVDELASEFPAVPRYRVLSGRALVDLARCVNTQDAVQAVRRSVEVFEKLAADFPKEAKHHSDLANSRRMLGWALRAAGTTDEAEKETHRAVQLLEKMATDFPNWDNRSKLANTLSALADLRRDANRPQEAKEAYWQALGEYEKLVIENPAQLYFHRAFAACVNAIVDLASTAGQPQEAENARGRSLELYGKLTAVFQKRADWHAQLVADHVDLADLLTKAGKAQEAEAAYARAVNAMAGLTGFINLKPDDPQVWLARGHAYAALKRWQDADADFSKAIGLSPDGEKLRRELASWCRQLAGRQKGLGHLEAAETAYGQALSRLEKLTADFPEVVDYRRELAGCQFALGLCLGRVKDRTKDAKAAYRQAVQRYEKLAAEFPAEPEYRYSLAACHNNLGVLPQAPGQLDEAEKLLRQAVTIHEKLMAEVPSKPHYRRGLARSLDNLGRLLAARRRYQEAEPIYRNALRLLDKLVAESPGNAEYRQALFLYSDHLAGLLAATGQTEEAEKAYRNLLELAPKSALAHNNLAWLLATCPEVKFRNATRAVELAKKAVELTPKEGNHWNTLGAAQYRAGDWKAAIAALEKSMELRKGGDSNDWFFLAMGHWQLGDKEQARKSYDQAVQWMEKNAPQNEELLRFRAEAAELLKIIDKENPK